MERVNAHNRRVAQKTKLSIPQIDGPTQTVRQSAAAFGGTLITSKQSSDEEKLNKTERRFLDEQLRGIKKPAWIGIQAITLKIGMDCRYTPDFASIGENGLTFWEIKGAHIWEDSTIKIKSAARLFPWATFIRAQWKNNQWTETEIKP